MWLAVELRVSLLSLLLRQPLVEAVQPWLLLTFQILMT